MKKSNLLIIIIVILANIIFIYSYSASLDIDSECQDKEYTKYLENLNWPSDETIRNKRISNDLISKDIVSFEKLLIGVLKKEYLPKSDDIMQNIIALENYREGKDYLILKYNVDNYILQIQDGKALYIVVYPRETNKQKQDYKRYVIDIAKQIFNIPENHHNENNPTVFVSNINLVDSKCGTISFTPGEYPSKLFYSYMRWWTDGNGALFEINKMTYNGGDLYKKAAPSKDLNKPRKFNKISY